GKGATKVQIVATVDRRRIAARPQPEVRGVRSVQGHLLHVPAVEVAAGAAAQEVAGIDRPVPPERHAGGLDRVAAARASAGSRACTTSLGTAQAVFGGATHAVSAR